MRCTVSKECEFSIKLYHGTIDKYAIDILRNGVLLTKSKRHLDFGPGFYTTPDFEFALTTAQWRAKRYNAFNCPHVRGVVVAFELDEVAFSKLNYRSFETASHEWGKFVVANRCENTAIHARYANNLMRQYDCVIGPTADGGNGAITMLVHGVDSGIIDMEEIDHQTIAPAIGSEWGKQFSFHTPDSLSCIKLLGVVEYDCRR